MTRREVLERYRVGIVNYRIKTLRYSQDQALSDLAQIEQSERLTMEEIERIVKITLPVGKEWARDVAQAIYQAQEKKKG